MLKDTENDTTHFSYKEYRKKTNRGNKDITVFISVFVIGVLIILGFVKILSPNVDVGIGENPEYEQVQEIEPGNVDNRLRDLKNEDEGALSSEENDIFSPEFDEKVQLPKQIKKTVGEIEAEMLNLKEQEHKIHEPKVHEAKEEKPVVKPVVNQQPALPETHTKEQEVPTPKAPAPSSVQTVNAKVVVGYYATENQAEVAKSILKDSNAGVSPIVKNMNGYYTLQVGAYSSKEKAQQAANNLLKNNFPARVIVE